MLNKKLQRFTLLVFLFTFLLFLFHDSYYFLQIYTHYISLERPVKIVLSEGKLIKLKSKCDCRKSDIYAIKYNNKVLIRFTSNNQTYSFNNDVFDTAKITCDMYNVFLRGPNQKVIGLSLYGTHPSYYNLIKNISILAKQYYPDWILRIYYDITINETAICELECLKDSNDNYINNIDFCNIHNIPFGSLYDTFSGNYLNKMTWRWLPIGDSFVDFFMSRDTDAWITEREVASVRVWLKTNNLFHIMRDHPLHDVPMLGGLWGYANVRDRQLGYKIFSIFTNEHFTKRYLKNGRSLKGLDQDFLADFIWQIAKHNATMHDSYFCKKYGGDPYPVQRLNQYCFISCKFCCDYKYTNESNYKCPKVCRPKDHKDWMYC